MSKPTASIWHPRGKFFVLLAAFFLLYILMPLVRDLRLIFLLSDVLLVAVLLATVYAVSGSRRSLIAAALLMGLSLVLLYLARDYSHNLMGAAHISILLFFVFTAVIILKDVLREERVSGDKIAGAISFYLLLGVAWGILYSLVFWANPASFSHIDPSGQMLRGDMFSRFIYFSFVTLTTLGYGDITPTTRVARSLASLEAVVGQLYLAILVARLVGLQISHSGREEGVRSQESGVRKKGKGESD